MLPAGLQDQLQGEIDGKIQNVRSVAGGSINRAAVVETPKERFFLKWNPSADPDMFAKEVKGLELLRSARTGLVIPAVIAQGTLNENTGWLLLEYVGEGRSRSRSAAEFGQKLAMLHKTASDRYGLDHDNYIGRLPQSNTWHESWIDFFVEERMEPQLQMAQESGKLSSSILRNFEALYEELPGIMPVEQPGLLHGDLWGGNYFFDRKGSVVVYDPAVYYGHCEMELAFTHLFGGFSGGFYRAYEEARPLAPGFDQRKDIYNLYPLLVHTNLFGGSYAKQVEAIVRRF